MTLMKVMTMTNKIFILLALLTLPLLAQAEGRDPFAPYAWEQKADKAKKAGQEDYDVTPLTEKPLSDYRITGTIISPTSAVGLIKGRDRREYLVSVGDDLGNEGGKIIIISGEGVTVDINGYRT